MSIERPLPIPIVQMGYVEKVAEQVQNRPEVNQLVAQETAKKALQEQKKQLDPADVTDVVNFSVNADAENQADHPPPQHRAPSDKPEQQEEEKSPVDKPFAGTIVNVKV